MRLCKIYSIYKRWHHGDIKLAKPAGTQSLFNFFFEMKKKSRSLWKCQMVTMSHQYYWYKINVCRLNTVKNIFFLNAWLNGIYRTPNMFWWHSWWDNFKLIWIFMIICIFFALFTYHLSSLFNFSNENLISKYASFWRLNYSKFIHNNQTWSQHQVEIFFAIFSHSVFQY